MVLNRRLISHASKTGRTLGQELRSRAKCRISTSFNSITNLHCKNKIKSHRRKKRLIAENRNKNKNSQNNSYGVWYSFPRNHPHRRNDQQDIRIQLKARHDERVTE